MKILLVEDDVALRTALETVLKLQHYDVDLAADGQLGLDLAVSADYDVVVLDVQVPRLDGISLCRQLRSRGFRKPILLMTAFDSDADVVAGLDAGADDYVSKPCAPEVFLARLRTLLRRSGVLATVPAAPAASTTLTWGELCLDAIAGRVTCGDRIIALTAKEFDLLELFLRNPDRIFSRSAILDRLWSLEDAPTDRAIVTHIKDVRKKLKAGGVTDDIIETVYGMGYRLKSIAVPAVAPVPPSSPKGADPYAIARVLERFRGVFQEQVAVLVQASQALATAQLDPDLQQTAQKHAHKLAGSLATFGYPNGSRLARSLEHLLRLESPPSADCAPRFAELVTALQHELAQEPVIAGAAPPPASPQVLVIDADQHLTEQLGMEAPTWALQIHVAADVCAARSHLAAATPDIILLDLSVSGTTQDGLVLLRELSTRSPQIPVVVFTEQGSLADRLAVSRLGARQFLHKPATPQQIFQAIIRVLPTRNPSDAKVLIVDDDPAVLALLSNLLTPWGLEIVTLSEPQRFWDVLLDTAPDVVLLDLEMPQVSGLELCQVVRQDVRWGDLPILVVTAHTDAASLQQAFAAGADDFITKPVIAPELITRVLSRIERTRAQRRITPMGSRSDPGGHV